MILPKLFRRFAEYLALDENPDSVSLDRFGAFLDAHADALFTVPDGHATTLDTLVQVTGQTVPAHGATGADRVRREVRTPRLIR